LLEEEDGIVIDPFCGTGKTEERVRVLRELSLHKVELTFRERKERGFWGI